ncbi:MAG TPA: glycoside hydrolase family 3 C-terminal domain-containing protein [Candidatus Sulfotelmatobacter sp.]|nr:glycoside hydrolase family 3 C-terminal domain-containing protein [Candidatus Sulfotelmatobacter sp.]
MIRTTLGALAVTATLCCGMQAQSQATSRATTTATDNSRPAYLNPDLTAEQRAADLVHRMTLEEKATQLVNQARAIPRLNIPSYDWWSESLHGVAAKGMTSFPEPIGLAATFDLAAIHEMAIAIGTEGRIHHVQSVRAGHSDIFEGLDFWAPNINIFRDPRWGRGQETYGEDPFLTGRMGTAFVTGMQGDDPRYYRVISTPKHFAVHSGPESTRHKANVDVSKHDELDTYLPAFRAAITQGKAGSIMCAYNSINGEPACASAFLLEDQLRDKWKFKGYVVSDCGAVIDIFNGHHFKPSQAEASAISLQRGMDNECADFFEKVDDDHDYKPYLDAVKRGALKESDIDQAVARLYTARIKLGLFDPPEMVPYNRIDERLLDSAAHRALARKMADESMVLLKNNGILPLKIPGPGLKIAIVGPLADQTKVLMGNYSGAPSHAVSVLDGLKAEFPTARINFVEGTQFLSKNASEVPPSLLTTDGKPGVRSTYLIMSPLAVLGGGGPPPTVLATRIDPAIGTPSGPSPAEIADKKSVLISSEATLTPKESGDYYLGTRGEGFTVATLDNKVVAMSFLTNGVETKLGRVHLETGKSYAVKVLYPVPGSNPTNPSSAPHLVWTKFDPRPAPEAIAAAKSADVVIAVVGITSELEGEEMPINEEGFAGGDRTSLDLPKPEEDLVEAVAATGKPLIVVLMNGSALSVNWAKDHANAILESWYAGEEGGAAIAETISGKNNPAGRLPITFYTGVNQLPLFEDYAMKNRTYRYFDGTPLYPFGYGLSYTTFSFSELNLSTSALNAGDPLKVEATVTNKGKIAGDEVVQLYLSFPKVAGAPHIALRGFQRVHLEPGASQKVQFNLDPRDLSIVTEAGEPVVPEGEFVIYVGGGQPHTNAAGTGQTFRVKGTVTLPE